MFRFHHFLLPFSALLTTVLQLRGVPAEGGISCVAPEDAVPEGGSAAVSCHFNEDVMEKRLAFSVVMYPFSASGDDNQSRVNVAVCHFGWQAVAPVCISEAGYSLDYSLHTVVTARIPRVTKAQEGRYKCQLASSHGIIHTCSCNLTVADGTNNITFVHSTIPPLSYSVLSVDSDEEMFPADPKGDTGRPIKAQIIPTLVIGILILMLFIYLCLRSNVCRQKRNFVYDWTNEKRPKPGRRKRWYNCLCWAGWRGQGAGPRHKPLRNLYYEDEENWVPRKKKTPRTPEAARAASSPTNLYVVVLGDNKWQQPSPGRAVSGVTCSWATIAVKEQTEGQQQVGKLGTANKTVAADGKPVAN